MSQYSAVRRLVVATGLGLWIAACSSSSGPSSPSNPTGLSNPTATTQKLQAVDATFQTPAFNSLRGLSTKFIPTSPPARSSRLAALIQATLPRASAQSRTPYAAVAQQALAIRNGLFSGAIGFSVLPSSVLGHTYVLTSLTSGYSYDASRTGAPANGVRFILYAVDPVTYEVASPLTETGYVDLIDQSTPSTNALEIKVVSGGTTYADYTVSGTYSSTSATLSIAGFVTDGTTVVNFNITYSADSNAGTFSEQSTIDVPSLNFHLVLNLDATSSVSGTVTTVPITLHFSMTIGSETVTADGTITTTLDSQSGATTVSGTIPVKVNGQTYAIINVSNSGTTITGPNGGTLTADQQQAVEELFLTGDQIELYILLLFVPFAVA